MARDPEAVHGDLTVLRYLARRWAYRLSIIAVAAVVAWLQHEGWFTALFDSWAAPFR